MSMWGGDDSSPGHCADEQMLRPPHEAGHSRTSCCAQTFLIGRINRKKTNAASQRSHFDLAAIFFTFCLVSFSSDFDESEDNMTNS